MQFRIFLILAFFMLYGLNAQKKSITHDDYDLWNTITETNISDSGNLIVTVVEPTTERGNGKLQIYNTKTNQSFSFDSGFNPQITGNDGYVLFMRKPDYEVTRQEKKKETKKDDLSKDDLFIYDVKANRIYDSINNVKTYKIPEKSEAWFVLEKYKEEKPDKKKDSLAAVKIDSSLTSEKESVTGPSKTIFKQNYALVYNLENKSQDTIPQIKEFAVPKNGSTFIYSLKQEKKNEPDLGVYKYNTANRMGVLIDSSGYTYSNLTVDDQASNLAYLSTVDSTDVDSLKYNLNLYREGMLKQIVDGSKGPKDGMVLSGDKQPYFSESSKRLYFGLKPFEDIQKDTTLYDFEIPEVDIWNWKDEYLQSQQKANNKEFEEKSFLSYYNLENEQLVQLQDVKIDNIDINPRKETKFVMGSATQPYALYSSWSTPSLRDVYIIDSESGKSKLVLKESNARPIQIPDGEQAIYYDMVQKAWYGLDLATEKSTDLTSALAVAFYDEENDIPSLPRAYGFGGFDTKGNTYVYDKFDVWRLSLNGSKKPVNITKDGRLKNIEYRLLRLDREDNRRVTFLGEDLLVTSFDKTTKASGIHLLRKGKLRALIQSDTQYIGNYKKAKDNPVFTYSKEDFQTYPDLYMTTNSFKTSKRITDINPHQKDFKWGTVEQFSWKAYDGTPLDGLIYKPENFDKTKKYPMITYFYEKRSDRLTRHSSPSPSRSTVNPAYLVSNDYVMFIPDIVYKEGKPGDSAFNCIVSGVEAVEKLGFVDSENLALQGQSWGGYQIAYLITKTNKFKAAMAGAPVSNMTSAYGGIRWGSGRSRAFQYENTQSRIGKNLWEGFDLYIENSPLFGIPNIETPLLMMHNDEDGAVPYYQGIEMFMGMRRLQKPAWLLVYNNEGHNLSKMKNRQDLSVRMMQFFNHYLKGEPAPKWMIDGLPRVHKGKDLGYELIDE